MLSRAEARSLTDEVKGDAERLWRKLVELYDGNAHGVLGHKSWGAYFKAEFGGTQSKAYQLLSAGQVVKELQGAPFSDLRMPANQEQARELSPLVKQPEKLREVWSEVVEEHPEPTAKQVREVVQRHTAPDTPKRATATPRVVAALKELYAAVQATPIEEVIAWEGNAKKLAGEWASVHSYITDLFATTNVAIPEVFKGAVSD